MKVNVDDSKQCGCSITAAPFIVKDKVIVGGSGGDGAHRGYLTAFFNKTGRFAWRWYVIHGPGEKGHETWKGDTWKFGDGAPWMTDGDSPVQFGASGGLLNTEQRKAASGHSILYALDAATGKVLFSSGDSIHSFSHFNAPVVAGGRACVTYDGTLYAFSLGVATASA